MAFVRTTILEGQLIKYVGLFSVAGKIHVFISIFWQCPLIVRTYVLCVSIDVGLISGAESIQSCAQCDRKCRLVSGRLRSTPPNVWILEYKAVQYKP